MPPMTAAPSTASAISIEPCIGARASVSGWGAGTEAGLIESLSHVHLAGLRLLGFVGGNGPLLCQNPLLKPPLPT
jgi:hypothetical protein